MNCILFAITPMLFDEVTALVLHRNSEEYFQPKSELSNENSFISRRLLSKRYNRYKQEVMKPQSTSSSSGFLIFIILIFLFVGVPGFLFLTSKYNGFFKCGDVQSDNDIELSHHRSKSRKKSKKLKHRSSSRGHRRSRKRSPRYTSDEDNSDNISNSRELNSWQDGENSDRKGSHKNKKIKNKSKKEHKMKTKRSKKKEKTYVDSTLYSSSGVTSSADESEPKTMYTETSNTNSQPAFNHDSSIINSNIPPASQVSVPEPIKTSVQSKDNTLDEYAYIVYKPDTNYIAVSRSLNKLIPPNTTVIYKVDETSNAKDSRRIRSVESSISTFENSPMPNSPASSLRSDYFIVNSDFLLKECDDGEEEYSKPKTLGSTKVSNETLFLYSTKASELGIPNQRPKSCSANPTTITPVTSQVTIPQETFFDKKALFSQTYNSSSNTEDKYGDSSSKYASKKRSKTKNKVQLEENSDKSDQSDDEMADSMTVRRKSRKMPISSKSNRYSSLKRRSIASDLSKHRKHNKKSKSKARSRISESSDRKLRRKNKSKISRKKSKPTSKSYRNSKRSLYDEEYY